MAHWQRHADISWNSKPMDMAEQERGENNVKREKETIQFQ